MTLNDLEPRNNPYFAFFFTKFGCFAGQLRHSGSRQTETVMSVIYLSPSSSLPLLAIPNPPRLSAIAELLVYSTFTNVFIIVTFLHF